MPPAERCDFFKRHDAKTDASRASSSTRGIPALVPSNSCCSRDPITRPGPGLHAQTNYYHTDDDTPIFRALLPALLGDMAVIDRVRAELERDLESGENVKNVYHYALVSHPGHHAGPSSLGGYCYVNNAAVLARALTRSSLDVTRVAVLDVDYHAGNGTAAIFWDDPDVFVASIHADPDGEYPWNSGYADDAGARARTRQDALPSDAETRGVERIRPRTRHRAQGDRATRRADTHRVPRTGHPRGRSRAGEGHRGYGTRPRGFPRDGQMIAAADAPIVFVQEGGYQVEAAGISSPRCSGGGGRLRAQKPRARRPGGSHREGESGVGREARGGGERRRDETNPETKRATAASSGTETDEGDGGVGTKRKVPSLSEVAEVAEAVDEGWRGGGGERTVARAETRPDAEKKPKKRGVVVMC